MNPGQRIRHEAIDSSVEAARRIPEFDALRLSVPQGKGKEVVWLEIVRNIHYQGDKRGLTLGTTFWRIAASWLVLLAIGGAVWFGCFDKVIVYSPVASHLVHILPDSSIVHLNAKTRIAYSKLFWHLGRKLSLEGEALFRVKRGGRFEVVTQMATTSVLGTTFNVYSREGREMITCIEGKVAVTPKQNANRVVLTKGLSTEINASDMGQPGVVAKSEQIEWYNGDFNFNNTPISIVFDELERQFDVDIHYEGDTNRFYTGYFNNRNLGEALSLVCLPMGLSYTQNGKTITIQRE
jgi:ferric-dicitrate binding protein FerR (iron transport regulator)